jgi:hypothetical protein
MRAFKIKPFNKTNIPIRVTRLGEFSPIERLITVAILFEKLAAGVDVMITIFCDFRQSSAKKIGVFLKNQSYDQIFAKTSSSLTKNANIFAKNFGENILKIITSVSGPEHTWQWPILSRV